jgi:hypothetical protein
MSDDFGKIAAISGNSPWRFHLRLQNLRAHPGPLKLPLRWTDAAWFPVLQTCVNLGFYRFYHDRITSATGATILV